MLATARRAREPRAVSFLLFHFLFLFFLGGGGVGAGGEGRVVVLYPARVYLRTPAGYRKGRWRFSRVGGIMVGRQPKCEAGFNVK